MSKTQRPSFLPLSVSSHGKSEYFQINQSKRYNQAQPRSANIYSPTNSIESDYSPICTPSTPGYLITPTEEYYLPYSPTPIGSRISIQSSKDHLFENRGLCGDKRSTFNESNHNLNSSYCSTTPDWYNESVNMNESFNFQPTRYHDTDSEDFDDLNRTLTNVGLPNFIDNNSNLRNVDHNNKQTVNHTYIDLNNVNHYANVTNEYHNEQFNCTESFEIMKNDNCPILFKQLMDLAHSSLQKHISKSQVSQQPHHHNGGHSTSSNAAPVITKFCKFCNNNREPRKFYLSHSTMDSNGDVICPILQQYKCELCGSTGKKAHTRSYCPFSRMIRETIPDINDTYEFYNKRSMIHSTDAHLFDNDCKEYLSDSD